MFLTPTRSQNITFDLFFIKNIYSEMIYLYFYSYDFHVFKLNNLKTIHDL
jgi:hypothetical protein